MWYFYSLRLKDIHIHQHTLRWETRSQSPLFLPLYLRQESRQTRSQSPFLSPQGPPHDFMKEWHLASVIHTSPEFKNKTKPKPNEQGKILQTTLFPPPYHFLQDFNRERFLHLSWVFLFVFSLGKSFPASLEHGSYRPHPH